jgi:cell division protease FtsH
VGPPGTGKTLLAKAVAGEAGVPFYSMSGSDFVEMFVGVGPSRVRDLFQQARKQAPSIIFIDEIDAVGRKRGSGGFGGGNDEREQTLNQILTEMDGFEGNSGVIVISATNRGDILDPALLRPGRFDRRVPVDLPDKPGREQILKVHARGKPLDADVTLGEIAARTTGFSGASLENLLNEAAIMAARRNRTSISYSEVDFAIDRIQVGLVKTGGGQSFPARQRLVAYHEAGHAVMGLLTPDYDTVTKVTIIPRSNGAGGFTLFTPSDEQLESGLYSKRYLEGQLAVALGGRVAEEIVYGEDEVTTGASSDLQQVRNIARRMVAQWGFTADDEVTADMLVGWEAPDAGRFTARTASGETEARIDLEVRRICDKAYENCYATLAKHRGLMDELTDQLIDKETINARELLEMLEKYDPKLFKELGKEAPPDLVPVPAA